MLEALAKLKRIANVASWFQLFANKKSSLGQFVWQLGFECSEIVHSCYCYWYLIIESLYSFNLEVCGSEFEYKTVWDKNSVTQLL